MLLRARNARARYLVVLPLTFISLFLINLFLAGLTTSAQDLTFADPAFQGQWQISDKPVQDGSARRSWLWGPTISEGQNEPYAESSGGQRLVQYFDKARMEINNPNASRNDRFFVSNGLLVTEMISGQIQTGDNTFTPNPAGPSTVQVAGDPDNSVALTYASFGPVASINGGNRASNLTGQFTVGTLSKDGTAGQNPGTASYGVTNAYYSEDLGHNIPNVFWNFLNQRGSIFQNGRLTNGQVFDWLVAVGLPLTEAYWSRAVVAGQEKDVLVQMFQRRVLTYTPSNDPDFRVEMGNVGQHYFRWRYTQPTPTPTPTTAPPTAAPPTPTPVPSLPPAAIPPGPANWSSPVKLPQAVARPVVRVNPISGQIYVLGENKGAGGIFAAIPGGPTINLKPGSGGEKTEAAFDNSGNLHVVFQEGTDVGIHSFYVRLNANGKVAWVRDMTSELIGASNSSGNPNIYYSAYTNRLYLATEENPQNLVLYESADQGQTWGSRQVIATGNRAQVYPRMVVNSAGTVIMTWTRNAGDANDVFGATRINGTWSNPVNLTRYNGSWNVFYGSIALAANGNDAYFSWISPGPGVGFVRYDAQSQSWTAKRDGISNTTAGSGSLACINTAVTSNGTVWVNYNQGRGDQPGGAYYVTSSDGGQTWSPVQTIMTGQSAQPCDLFGIAGNVYFTGNFERQTYFSYRSQ